MKACPLLNFGAKMLDMLDLEAVKQQEIVKGPNDEEQLDMADIKRRNTMVSGK